MTPDQQASMLGAMNRLRDKMHVEAFPLNENLRTLLFIVASDLSSTQREAFTQYQTTRNISINHYQMQQVTDYFHQVICSQVTHLENPSLRNNRLPNRGFRSFIILEDYGECDGNYGYWAQDEEDGAEGFLDGTADVFSIWDEDRYAWAIRRFRGRRMRKGRRKGKGKGRGFSGRSRFRPMRRSKGSGKGHAAEGRPYGEESWYDYNENADYYQGHADWMKGKKGKRGGGKSGGKGRGSAKSFGKGQKGLKGKQSKGEGKADSTQSEWPFFSRPAGVVWI